MESVFLNTITALLCKTTKLTCNKELVSWAGFTTGKPKTGLERSIVFTDKIIYHVLI
jgi:hypothetical protein